MSQFHESPPHEVDELLQQPNLNLRVEAEARVDLGHIVREAETTENVLAGLYGVAEQLLASTSSDFMTAALQKIFELVPAAQRISLVAWPPEVQEDGQTGFRHLVPSQLHPVWGKDGPAISRSLITKAVESRRALLFSHAQGNTDMPETASIVVQRIRSAVYVPLIGREDSVLGVLIVDTPKPWLPFEMRDFHFIRAVGALLTASLDAEKLREAARQRELEAREMSARREAMVAFLKIASHDLKGPLSVVNMAAYTLSLDATPEQKEFVDYILGAARSARSLIDTYLQACHVDSGKALKLAPETINPQSMVDEELRVLRRVALEDRAEDFILINEVTCTQWTADTEKFRQVVANLLSNACKYSPQGGTVRVSSTETAGHLEIAVHDQGVGISEIDQQRLFRQFERVGDTAIASGSGLGLWLVQALVNAHGGTLRVASTPGSGSCFAFTVARHLPTA